MAKATDPLPADHPQPGYFTVNVVRGGPQMAAQISEQDGTWTLDIDGVGTQSGPDPYAVPRLLETWLYGKRVSESEHRYRIERRRWMLVNAPSAPECHPFRPVNPRTVSLEALIA